MDSVSLKDFISETLTSISLGVANAQDASKAASGIPIALHSVGKKEVEQGEQLVRFTVSLQAESSTAVSGSAGIAATVISVVTGKVDVSVDRRSQGQSVHTVEFSVPMHFNSRWPKESEDQT
jgi:hypothetical protein